jgi:uncharacterized membrane protein YfcA
VLLAALALAAFVAGFIDAIAGGGGLITVPALFVAVPDARVALGTNKGQSVFGAFSALVTFWRRGHVDRRRALPTFFAASAGALVGAKLVLSLDPEALRPIALGLLVTVAVSFALRGRSRKTMTARPSGWPLAVLHPLASSGVIGFVLGGYDGFFGPGTGTFLIAAYAAVLGDDLTKATANAKVANFASNLTSVAAFALAGRLRYDLALPMAAAQLVGGWLGARSAIRGGERFVRAGVLLITSALVVRLAYQLIGGG